MNQKTKSQMKLDDILNKKYDPTKKYRIYVQISSKVNDGYICLKPELVVEKSNEKFFLITYYFKTISKNRNPIFVIEKLEGDDFKERTKFINLFAQNYALKMACSIDGINDL